MMLDILKVIGFFVFSFVITYSPMFLLGPAYKSRPRVQVPVIICSTLMMALVAMALYSRFFQVSLQDMGLASASIQSLAQATFAALPFAFVLTFWCNQRGFKSPFGDFKFGPLMAICYFVIGASIQEEVIFRGLLQSQIMHFELWSILVIAILFAALHIGLSWPIGITSFVLSLLAGYFRMQTGSLLPAIAVHACFNGCSAFWQYRFSNKI